MTGSVVHARVTAVRSLADGLASYERSLATALASARADLNSAGAEFQVVLARSQQTVTRARQRVDALRDELARCKNGCEELSRALEEAKVVLAMREEDWRKNKRAEAHFERAASELQTSIRTIQASAAQTIPSGRKFIRNYAETLTEYLKRQGA